MKNFVRKAAHVVRAVFSASLKIILLALFVEVAVTTIAIVVGVLVLLNQGLLAGVLAGAITFLVGQSVAILVLDVLVVLPLAEKSGSPENLPSQEEEIARLKSELEATTKED